MENIRIPTEPEVAELVSNAGPIARGLAFERDMLRAEIVRLKNVEQLTKQLIHNIKTSHLDMSGKHRYVVSHDAYKIIEPLKQLLVEE